MNREILFRGKNTITQEWVYGDLDTSRKSEGFYYINYGKYDHSVIPETVCQFTGLLDKNGNKIWEGDIVNATTEKGLHYWSIEYVRWCSFVGFVAYGKNRRFNIRFTDGVIYRQNIEVIGNIFDNKELLNN